MWLECGVRFAAPRTLKPPREREHTRVLAGAETPFPTRPSEKPKGSVCSDDYKVLRGSPCYIRSLARARRLLTGAPCGTPTEGVGPGGTGSWGPTTDTDRQMDTSGDTVMTIQNCSF